MLNFKYLLKQKSEKLQLQGQIYPVFTAYGTDFLNILDALIYIRHRENTENSLYSVPRLILFTKNEDRERCKFWYAKMQGRWSLLKTEGATQNLGGESPKITQT